MLALLSTLTVSFSDALSHSLFVTTKKQQQRNEIKPEKKAEKKLTIKTKKSFKI